MTLVPTNENKGSIKKYEELWSKIRVLIKTKNSDDYGKKYMKIKFNSDHQLPINKTIEIPIMTIVVIAIFLDNIKYYYTPCDREICHYEKANVDLICRSIDQFPWDFRFAQINENQKVYLFNQTVKKILCNFKPHETVTCDDRDPLCITSKIKGLI